MFPERIETDRLVLERLCHENIDLFELYRVCSDADGREDMTEVTQYMPWCPHKTVNESREFIEDAEKNGMTARRQRISSIHGMAKTGRARSLATPD